MTTYLKDLQYKDGQVLKNGKVMGYKNSAGYLYLNVTGKTYPIHGIVFLMHYGYLPKMIDHINGDRTDNRIENLRECNLTQNNCNTKKRLDNTSGYKNVGWHKKANKWAVQIQVNGKKKHIGIFEDLELADLVAQEARNKYHKGYARHA